MIPLHDDNPTTLRPIVTVALIILCVGAFLWQISLGERGFAGAVRALGLIPANLLGNTDPSSATPAIPATITMFTSMFLHGGWMHLIGNMLYLWIFGNNVEDSMGHGRFVLFYLACGVAAALAQALPNPDSMIPMIGASGAISGVLGAYLLLFPHARVMVLLPLGIYIRMVQLPAMWVLGFWIVLQVINSIATEARGGGVAWGAHIGGFVAGALLIPLFKRRGVPLWAPPRRHA